MTSFYVILVALLYTLCHARVSDATCNIEIASLGATTLTQLEDAAASNFRGAYGENPVTNIRSVVNIKLLHGLTDNLEVITQNSGSCAIDIFTNTLVCESGTTAGSFGFVRGRQAMVHHAGTTMVGRFTTAFIDPCTTSNVCTIVCAFSSSTDAIQIGFVNGVFSVSLYTYGMVTIRELTLSAEATVANDALVTIGGIGYTVPLTDLGTVEGDAFEIAASLNSQVPGYIFYQNEGTVLARGLSTFGLEGTFAYDGQSTGSAGSWAVIATRRVRDINVIEEGSFNGDNITWLNTTAMNTYQIVLGFDVANVCFHVLNPSTGTWDIIHSYSPGNEQLFPITMNSNMHLGWLATNFGDAVNARLIASMAMGGQLGDDHDALLYAGTVSDTNIGVTSGAESYHLSIRVRSTLNTMLNSGHIHLESLIGGTESTRGAIFRFYVGCELTGVPNWIYNNEVNSIVEYDTSATGCTGGDERISMVAAAGVNLDVSGFNIVLLPNQILTVTAQLTSGPSADTTVTVVWGEDR